MATNNSVNASGTGFQSKTSGGVWNGRTLQAGAGISITNPDGVSGDPTITATGGAVQTFTYISTQTASVSSSLDFTSIDNTYKAYRFLINGLLATSGTVNCNLSLSTDNLSTLVTLDTNIIKTQGTTPVTTKFAFTGTAVSLASTSSTGFMGYVDLIMPGVATVQAQLIWDVAGLLNSGAFGTTGVGQDAVREAINAVRFIPSASTWGSGNITLYGIS